MNDKVILVDTNDQPLGEMNKLEVHQKGLLHRAFSIFIFNDKGELLLQRRSAEKYHSANLWTNTCCSHPMPEESTLAAARRRLKEEMGIEAELEGKFDFIYHANLDNGLIEHEFDHVYTGKYTGEPSLNKTEASGHRWVSVAMLREEIRDYPERFTEWLKIAIRSF
jgi:isopentenyl-diphosphate delta-isomerase